jgi:hypothetical protein
MSVTDSKKPTEAPKVPLLIRFFDPEVHAPDPRGRTLDNILNRGDDWFERSHDYVQILFPLPEGSPFNFAAPVITRTVFEAFRERPELRAELRRAWVRMMKFYGFDVVEEGAEEVKSKDEATSEAEAESEVTSDDAKKVEEGAQLQESEKMQDTEDAQPIESSNTEGAEVAKENVTQATDPITRKPIKLVPASNYQKMFRNWVLRFDHNHLRITRVLRSLRVLGLQEECDAFFSMLVQVYEKFEKINERSFIYWKRAVERPIWIAPDDERVHWLRAVCQEMAEDAETKTKELAEEKETQEVAGKDGSSEEAPQEKLETTGHVGQQPDATAATPGATMPSQQEPAQDQVVGESRDVPVEEAEKGGAKPSGSTEEGKWDKVQNGDAHKWDTIGKTDGEKEKWRRLEDSKTAS